MSKVPKSIERQERILEELSSDFEEYKNQIDSRKSRGYVNACLSDVDEVFKCAKGNHSTIVNSAADPQRDKYISDEIYAKIKQIYFKFSGMISDDIDKFPNEGNTNLDFSRLNTTKSAMSDIRLPRINIKPFSGKPEDWSEFHNVFESLIDQNTDLSEIQKLQFLKSSLADKPGELISHLPIDSKSYASAWQIINDRFQNKRKLVNTQLRILLEQQKITFESADLLKSLHDTTNQCLHALSNLGINVDSWDPILIYIIYHKLPKITQRDWEATLGTSRSIPDWKTFLAFIEGRFSSLENFMESNSHQKQQLPSTSFRKVTSNTYHVKTDGEDKQFRCRLCKGAHSLRHCKKFLKMNVKSRMEVTKRNSICSNCLGYDHHANNCNSINRCFKCNLKHHTLLHIDRSQHNMEQNTQHQAQQHGHRNVQNHYCQHSSVHNNSTDVAGIANSDTMSAIQNQVVSNQLNQNATSYVPNKSQEFINCGPSTSQNAISAQAYAQSQNQPYTYQQCSINNHLARDTNVIHTPQIISNNQNETCCTSINQMHTKALLATALVKVSANNGNEYILRALIDPGSEATFVTENVTQLLKLKKQKASAQVTGLGQTSTGVSNHQVEFTIRSLTRSSFSLQVKAFVFKQLTSLLPAYQLITKAWTHLHNLPLAEPSYSSPGKIDLLLGADAYASIILEGLVKGEIGAPVAQYTELGWILTGNTNNSGQSNSITIQNHFNSLDVQLKRFWELEEDLETRKLTQEEKLCEEHFQSTCKRLKDGRYEVQLPFKNNIRPSLGNSKRPALARFFQIEKRLDSNSKLKEAYTACITEYLTLGHMQEITEDMQIPAEQHYFLPHHAVFKESSTTTKLRVVFDASCKSSNGESLNDNLMIGPRIQSDIIDLIAKWRKFKVAFVADISMMYRQIWMKSSDTPYQLIVWRNKTSDPLKTYCLKTVTFGTASAPFLAVRTLHQLAADVKTSHPHVSKVLTEGFYVDDLIHGSNNESDAIKLQGDTLNVLKSAGFPLRKWASNSAKVLSQIPENEREINLPLDFDSADSIKTLGIRWHPAQDVFKFQINLPEAKGYTKRSVLADVARLFDPLGWISPCIIKAKLILQQLWIQELGWDNPISKETEDLWKNLRNGFIALERIQIPRWLQYEDSDEVQLHGFSDASEKAYAAVVYARIVKNGREHIHILSSKTRVAPLKCISLPRLELCAALLLAKLLRLISRAMQFQNPEVFAWCDSTIALAWIKGSPLIRTTFVANRVSEIQTLTSPTIWRHVISKDNPADIGSRGLSPEELLDNQLWWHGPNFLRNFSLNEFPAAIPIDTNLETKGKINRNEIQVGFYQTNLYDTHRMPNLAHVVAHCTINKAFFEQYSTLRRMVRTVSIWRRYFANLKNPQNKKTLTRYPITSSELSSAHVQLIKIVQKELFLEDITSLKDHNHVCKRSKILSLNPFLDSEGLLRVGGRLSNSALPFNQRHPFILKDSHHFSKLIVSDIHQRTLHGGVQMMMAEIRNTYWITNIKRLAKSIIHKCVRCHRHKAKMQQQLMGNLPAERVTCSRPFTNTGVDYAGPIEIKAWKGRCNRISKGYIAVFVCLSTKAIHIELVHDLSTASFIAAFRRFVARRGAVANIFSDCGTNFKGAHNELKRDSKFISSEWSLQVAKELATRNTTWHFNPPSSPHFGGLWEAGVKSIKHHIKRTIGNSKLTFEEYSTLLTQIEACLNSRPLCPMSSDPDDLTVLTPGHFLIGGSMHTVPERNLNDTNLSSLDKWRYIQRLLQEFWKQWSVSYIHLLQQRPKWLQRQPNLNVGDIVIVKEDNLPPSSWALARITELHPGSDGLTRVATIKTSTSILKRPIVKLSPLPVSEPMNNT